jgi:hypothetical protein
MFMAKREMVRGRSAHLDKVDFLERIQIPRSEDIEDGDDILMPTPPETDQD